MGVKSLWSLLTPVARPVMLETMEGKAMAIDSSIWIYQFQATMRDKEGRALVNAHVLGFLRRICKLLFYGIKPVFVFDGGAPALKRMTISERKKKKSGAAASLAKVAEKLLAAQMRREAINHAYGKESASSPTSKGKDIAPIIDENTVFLEDLLDSTPRTPAKPSGKGKERAASSASKKSRWHDHDPYRLPEINLEAAVAKATSSTAPDPRLATEDELRAFIEEMRPEDFDVTSPAFRELPTEVQYEIIGDLRLKSRQTSHKRLQSMLQASRTPLDFSRAQIKNLKERNSLTQQLLTTTDSIGKAQITIPIRIASERNREYVLVKNEGASGGWVLGIRDDGTQAKPIQVVEGESDNDSDAEMEEIGIPETRPHDTDLREYRRELALTALAERYSPKKHISSPNNSVPTTVLKRKPAGEKSLFMLDSDNVGINKHAESSVAEEDDIELEVAIQESLEQEEATHIQRAIEESKASLESHSLSNGIARARVSTMSSSPTGPPSGIIREHAFPLGTSFDDDLYVSPSRLDTFLSLANTKPPRTSFSDTLSSFGRPFLLTSSDPSTLTPIGATSVSRTDSDDDMEEVNVTEDIVEEQQSPSPFPDIPDVKFPGTGSISKDILDENIPVSPRPITEMSYVEDHSSIPELQTTSHTVSHIDAPRSDNHIHITRPMNRKVSSMEAPMFEGSSPKETTVITADPRESAIKVDSEEEDNLTDWSQSRSPSPAMGLPTEGVSSAPAVDGAQEGWDAAEEMDPEGEEGEFARFVSEVKGRDLNVVRAEIDEEIKDLNKQRKLAMRDSEDITHQMVSQIMLMLRLFGIPYITAPMEAEAQCAELVSLGLVEGVITDDSDVFLFGSLRVFKNMFNQSKTVECFLLSDLARELGLDRDTLIRLAYLLGSDYVEGLPGVGPVVAMELLKEFPGDDGLHKFKDWWIKVQTGRDKESDNTSKFRKRFKKKFKNLHLHEDWPNSVVRDAYYHPTVDSSEEPFKWGLPDLDALRHFFGEELGWSETKVDDLLLPIIQKMGKRGLAQAANKQGTLNEFFDITAGSGTYAPRKRQAYSSKRLQQVVTDYRNERVRMKKAGAVTSGSRAGSTVHSRPSEDEDETQSDVEEPPPKKRKAASVRGRGRGRGKQASTRGTGKRGRGTKSGSRSTKSKSGSDNDEDNEEIRMRAVSPPPLAVNLRPRPKPKPAYITNRDGEDNADEEE